VELRFDSTLLLSTGEKPQNRCPNRVQILMNKTKKKEKKTPAEKYEHFLQKTVV